MLKFTLKVVLFIPFFFLIFSSANTTVQPAEVTNPISNIQALWIDSLMQTLSLDQKIAQLVMLPAYPMRTKQENDQLAQTIKKYNVGGVIFFKSEPHKQAQLTNQFQDSATIPLLIAGDYEWGLSMRMDSTLPFPRQMMLGAIENEKLIYDMGAEFARQFRTMGIHINFAPVADINNNPQNPVIGYRSFGEERNNVTRKAFAYAMGMQHNAILPTIKHFPGHGDTDQDSHKTLPIISGNLNRLDSIELYPFREIINAGIAGVMIAHLHVPALDSSKNSISSVSKPIVTNLLRKKYGFDGLIFTDALDMKGIADNYPPGVAEVEALKAGVDILLMPQQVATTIKAVKQAIVDSVLSVERINQSVRRVLQTKFWVGLNHYKPIDNKNLTAKLKTHQTVHLREQLIEHAITLVENKNNILPVTKLDSVVVASVAIGNGAVKKFQQTLNLYAAVQSHAISKYATPERFNSLKNKLKNADIVVVSLHNTNRQWPNFGISPQSIQFINELSQTKTVVLNIFASPYALDLFADNQNIKAIVVSYDDTYTTQHFSAQLIFGGIEAVGRLPVNTKNYPYGTGVKQKKTRLKYAHPLDVNIDANYLKNIDSIILGAINDGATPGAQILAARNGTVFFSKSYGYHTYEKQTAVQNHHLYDIASVTKVAATTNALMMLADQSKFDVKKKLSHYLPELDSTNKKNILVKDVLAHQARLQAWIPFYLRTFDKSKGYDVLIDSLYTTTPTEKYAFQVAQNLYIDTAYTALMYQRIFESKLRRRAKYYYSDLGFYLFYKAFKNITGTPLEIFAFNQIFAPIGACHTLYNPTSRFDQQLIVPTENDVRYRKQLLQGYVHDYGAAMMGGYGAHAGLFSNANDLAKIAQMWLQKGQYGGKRYISETTLADFTTAHFLKKDNRRGYGFDKPPLKKQGSSSEYASMQSFGHTGFTGAIVWVDPKYDLVYVFLSNRIHPDIENKKLIRNDIRSRVHDVFYKAMTDVKVKNRVR